MTPSSVLPGGAAARTQPAGVRGGAKWTRIDGPKSALQLVSEELTRAEIELRTLIHTDVAAVETVAGYLIAAGGKRLRPALTALGARAVGLTPAPVRRCCVGELLHLGSLLHDDVVDDGETRRDQPAAHRVYGNAVTVLTGDFCLARAVLLASEEGGPRAVHALGAVVTEMAEGEVLQLQRAGNLDCTIDQYLDVVARKSAALIGWCARAGALATGQMQAADALERYGREVGTAFQIADDVLDYATGTGKTRGADLRERKVTLPLLFAMRRDPSIRARLADGPPSPSEIETLVGLVAATGALEEAIACARARVASAVSALDVLPPSDGHDALVALAGYLVERAR